MNVVNTVVDIETTMQLDDNKKTITSPFFGQQIVSVGYNSKSFNAYDSRYLFFYHEGREPTPNAFNTLQSALDKTDILIGHNIKFDLGWLRECGIEYRGKLFDTMVAEYILQRGQKKSLTLDECCRRRGIPGKSKDKIDPYLKEGLSYEAIPWDVVEEYGKTDVDITGMLAQAQLEDFGVMSWEKYVEGKVHVSLASA